MALHAYCVVMPALAPNAGLTGIGGAPVRSLPLGGDASAWVSDGGTPARPSVDLVRDHDAVVKCALDDARAVLPLRFGQRFASESELLRELHDKAGAIVRALDAVAGCVEMSVIIPLPEPPKNSPVAPGIRTGKSYLEGIKAQMTLEQNLQSSAEVVRGRVREAVGVLVRDEVVRLDPPPNAILTLSHLILRTTIPEYRNVLDGLRRDAIRELVVAGPNAAYSFVTLDG